jgi:hypothetical protein
MWRRGRNRLRGKDATSLRTFVELMLERFSASSLAQKDTYTPLWGQDENKIHLTEFSVVDFVER